MYTDVLRTTMKCRRRRRLEEGKEKLARMACSKVVDLSSLNSAELQAGLLCALVRAGHAIMAFMLCAVRLLRNNVPRIEFGTIRRD